MSDPTPPAPAADPGDQGTAQENATIRQMRAQIEAQTKAAKEASDRANVLQAQLTERERAEMAEIDRLKAEVGDRDKKIGELEPLRDEHGKFVSAFEAIYQNELALVPDDKRAAVETLSKVGSWPERLDALRAAKGLLPSATPAAPAAAGTRTLPAGGAPPPAGDDKPKTMDPKNPPPWRDVLSRPKPRTTA